MKSENRPVGSVSPYWVPSQDLITESLQKKLVKCTPSVITYKLHGVFQKFSRA